MKICITSESDNLDSKVESRFGRSPYFIIYDTNTADFEAIKNPNIEESSGVGIKSGQLIADKKVSVVLTGKVGPKAFDALKAAGIEIIDTAFGTVKETIDKYQAGSFKISEKPTDKSQFIGAPQGQGVQIDGWFGRCFRRWFEFGSGRGRRGKQSGGSGQGMGQGRGGRGKQDGGSGQGRGGRGKQDGGSGQGMGQGRGIGRGQGGGRRDFAGPGGYCVCPKCGQKIKHDQGVPCRSNTCGKCGTIMVRK